MKRFQNRKEAGEQLAQTLLSLASIQGTELRILALPRGGVPVAVEIAVALRAPLDVLVVRKLGVPWQPELAFGAVATGNVQVINQEMVQTLSLSEEVIRRIAASEMVELQRREELYRGNRPALDVKGCAAILVDDGIATGATILAAVEAVRRRQPASVIVAVPVAPPEVVRLLKTRTDEVVTIVEPKWLNAVGAWYWDFPQVTDEEVRTLFRQTRVAAGAMQQMNKL